MLIHGALILLFALCHISHVAITTASFNKFPFFLHVISTCTQLLGFLSFLSFPVHCRDVSGDRFFLRYFTHWTISGFISFLRKDLSDFRTWWHPVSNYMRTWTVVSCWFGKNYQQVCFTFGIKVLQSQESASCWSFKLRATMFLSKDAQTNVYTQAGETYPGSTKSTIFHLLSWKFW